MWKRLVVASLSLVMALALLTGGAAAASQASVAMPAKEAQGEPENAFVKEMSSLFASEPDTQGRRMSVLGIMPAPAAKVTIWTDAEVYRPGDTVRLYFDLPRPAYVYILNVDTRDDVRLIFPNEFDRDNYINTAGTTSLPRGRYIFPVKGLSGREYLLLIAASERLPFFDRMSQRGDEFPLLDHPDDFIRTVRDWTRSQRAWTAFAWNSFRIDSRHVPTFPRNKPPMARIRPSNTKVTAGETVTFSGDGSDDDDGFIRSYRWDLNGDGRNDAEGPSAKWTYNSPGTYTVRLTVEDNRGADASATVQIVVEPKKTLLEITGERDAAVYVDGSYVGRGTARHYVAPGTHEIKVVATGQRVFTTTVSIPTGMDSLRMQVNF